MALTFDERLALLVDQHATWRENKAMARRLKTSKLDAEPRTSTTGTHGSLRFIIEVLNELLRKLR